MTETQRPSERQHEAPRENNRLPMQDGVMTAISRAELDAQITTARAYPRSVRRFIDDAMSMALLNEQVADECYYALPARGGDGDDKPIEGASIRLAEILLSAWGNCRAGTRVIEEGAEFVVAQGVFKDLEKNTEVSKEVRRRITTKTGRRYGADMIGVTANAACSIALRNAITAGIPRALWNDVYESARRASVGTEKTLVAKRTAMLAFFAKQSVTEAQVCTAIGVRGVEDIDLSKLATLKGIATAIKDGETTIEQAFRVAAKPGATGAVDLNAKGVDALAARMDAAAGLTDEEKRRLKGETPVAIPTVTVTPTVSVSLPKPADQPTAAPTQTEEGREATIRTLMQGEAEAAAGERKFPLVPLDDSTAFWIADLDDVQSMRPLLGTVTYLGTAFGFQQWDGTQWRTIPEDDVEAYYDRAILAMRKRLSKRWKDAGKDRAAAMLWVKEALELKVPPASLSPFTLDQLVKMLGLLGAEPKR